MTELKTLKDLCEEDDIDDNTEIVSRKVLKAEAIKWVKEKETMTKNDWINFFSITKEDLK